MAAVTVIMATTIVTAIKASLTKIRVSGAMKARFLPMPSAMPSPAPSDDELKKVLRDAHPIAVVGLSLSKFRPSYGVSQYMQSAGYRIIPVNPNEREALGKTPAGVFRLGTSFGYADQRQQDWRMGYQSVASNYECVDDPSHQRFPCSIVATSLNPGETRFA